MIFRIHSRAWIGSLLSVKQYLHCLEVTIRHRLDQSAIKSVSLRDPFSKESLIALPISLRLPIWSTFMHRGFVRES